jgi:hypothetical protein
VSCPGLHCPGCTGGQSLGVLAGVVVVAWIADETVLWVAQHIWWIAGTLAVCFALATAATMWLERLSDARCARFAERRGIASRADVDDLTQAGVAYLLRREQDRVALGRPQTVITGGTHLWVTGQPDAEQAEVIRQALPGYARGIVTGEP